MLYSLLYDSPVGPIEITSDERSILRLNFHRPAFYEEQEIPEVLHQAAEWLDRYFSGTDPGTPPPMEPYGTPFQHKVWKELLTLKWNELITYSELARRVGSNARAVGQALGCNPIPLFIPCHRIVAVNGLGGYTPGIEIKRKLLAIESGENTLDFPA